MIGEMRKEISRKPNKNFQVRDFRGANFDSFQYSLTYKQAFS